MIWCGMWFLFCSFVCVVLGLGFWLGCCLIVCCVWCLLGCVVLVGCVVFLCFLGVWFGDLLW